MGRHWITITKSIEINKKVAALKNNHGANITRYWPPAHCAVERILSWNHWMDRNMLLLSVKVKAKE